MSDVNLSVLVSEVQTIARQAGAEIRRLYQSGDWSVTAKADESPVTQADLLANEIITTGLEKLGSQSQGAMIVSEESDPHRVQLGERFWLVDPLDGTKDFVARRDTFVVSIGLIERGEPVLGVLYSPVLDRLWWAVKGEGAFADGVRIFNDSDRRALIAAGSRSMTPEQIERLTREISIREVQRYGSALKFGRLAEGEIDFYPRFGLINEWDTAAGQVIAEEAGCKVVDLSSGERLRYGKPGLLHRCGFVAARDDLGLVKRLKAVKGS
jgi:3'(2'), 5'-bisphosphate nucleotidase